MKYLKKFNESEEREERNKEKEGTFDYFMTKSREELLNYQKNFQHSFKNPAEHDPKYIAWKNACVFKGCFKVPSIKTLRKIRELEGKADDDWIYKEEK